MIIYPAIDLYQGKAVRLYQGDYANMTVYSDRPLSVAEDFVRQGATHIHLVDLEGARTGETPNLPVVEEIARQTGLFAEVGGGIRSMETVKAYLSAGVSRVILGTAALQNPTFLAAAVAAYGEKIAVGADVREGCIAVRGWLETSACSLEDFLSRMQAAGVRTVVCTDISRDGAMRGANLELYRRLSERFRMDVIASGGVSALDDVRELRRMGLAGAIIGKAYYTGAVSLREAIEVAK